MVNNPEVVSCGMVDEFFEKNFLAYVRSLYDVTVKVHTSVDEVIRLLVQAIQNGSYDKTKVNVLHSGSFQRRQRVFQLDPARTLDNIGNVMSVFHTYL